MASLRHPRVIAASCILVAVLLVLPASAAIRWDARGINAGSYIADADHNNSTYSLKAGETYTAYLIFRNRGTRTWTHQANVSLVPKEETKWFSPVKPIPPGVRVPYGSVYRFTFRVHAPDVENPRDFDLKYQMAVRKEGNVFFGDVAEFHVRVRP